MFKLIIFLLFPAIMLSQTFKSSATAHIIESYEIEFMERTIEISDDEILIISQGKEYKDIQTLNVVEMEEKEYGELGVCTWYYCNSNNLPGSEKLIIVPIQKKPNQISIFEPSKDGASTKKFKIILD